MGNKKFSDYVVAGDNITLTYDNIADTVTIDAASNVDSVNGQTGVVVLTKTDVGLGNVENTSDANKPISTATQTALNLKQNSLVSGTNIKTINTNTLLGSGDLVIDKTSVGLSNVANVDTTNASNISSGTLSDSRLSSNVTTQGNTFNAANKLVQLDASAKLPAVDGSQLTNLPSFSPPNGLLKIASAISTTFQAVTDYLGNVSVLFLNSRRIGIGKDTSVTTQSVAVVEVQDANTSIVLKPNGTGAIIASVPDGTAVGGNARGVNAVDLQMARSNASQVVSGSYSIILAGASNKVTKDYSISGGINCSNEGRASILFGNNNTIALDCDNSGILCGNANTLNSGSSAILSGRTNTLTSTYGVIAGGQGNTGSTSSHVTVVGGQSNTSSGQHSISGGSNTVSSSNYSLALNYQTQATNQGAAAININTYAVAVASLSHGFYSRAYLPGGVAQGMGTNSNGDYQSQIAIVRNIITTSFTSGATSILSTNVNGGQNDAPLIPYGNNRAWNVQIDTIAVVTAITGTATGVSVGDVYSEVKNLLFKRIGGTSSIVGTVDTSFIKSNSGMSTAAITITAGGSQQMAITFTAPTFVGGGSVTCRVVSKVSLVEVAY